ncbi:hypothetical protein UFOVP1670_60 [uncultured Caudovirales phage]|uniref:DUF559 domain-containing protein n=1 Tax=uncultured Caudovirales phage TaxID=2100421 RepID=A0A6J5TAG9_9CAUD|nr:hypothetical protein UFOVP1670_60 [uncultured Caudovirales phage]
MRMTEEGYAELMKKRIGWKPGSIIATGNTVRAGNELVREQPGEATPNPGHPAPRPQPGKKRSAAAQMRTERQALQKATGEVVRKESQIEILFAQQIQFLQLPKPKRNYLFNRPRKQELDFAWLDQKLAVEVQGMVHRIKKTFKADIEKRAIALLAGWRILEVGGDEIRSGQASKWLQQLMAQDVDKELGATRPTAQGSAK